MPIPPSDIAIPPDRPGRGELLLLILLCLAYAAANVATLPWYPNAWCDEVAYNDPGVNLSQGRGFVSSAWYSQPDDELWMSNSPGHSLLAAAWMRCCEFNLRSVRALNVVLMIAAVWVFWYGLLRHRLLRRPRLRILAVAAFLLGSPIMAWLARSGRPDTTAILLACLALPVTATAATRTRLWGLFVLGALIPLVGVGLMPFAAVVGLSALATVGWKAIFKEGLALAAGASVGLVAMLAVLARLGCARTFLAMTFASGHTTLGGLLQAAALHDTRVLQGIAWPLLHTPLNLYRYDTSYHIVLAWLLAACIAGWLRGELSRRQWPVACVVAAILMPMAMHMAGKFPIYYAWTAYLPALLGCLTALDAAWADNRRALACSGVMAVAAALILTVAPLTLRVQASVELDLPKVAEEMAARHVRADDVVFCSCEMYYAVKPRAKRTYLAGYSGGRLYPRMRPTEQEAIGLAIVSPADHETLLNKVGGEWVEVDRVDFGWVRPTLLDNLMVPERDRTEGLIVLRRKSVGRSS